MVAELRTVRIGDLGRVVTGKTPPSAQPELFGADYPFLTPTDMDGAARYIEPERFLSPEGRDYQQRMMLPARTVCVVCIGATIGKVCMTSRPSFSNQQINSVVVNEDEHDPFFVYHLMTTLRDELKSNAGGAATPIINKSAFSEIEVSVPPLPIQQRIAGILSAYDELIENSQRRIRILESMARALYREWFVHFRFPGFENHPRVASPLGEIPQGWEVTELAKVCADGKGIQTGPFGSQLHEADYSDEGVPVVMPKDLIGFRIRPDSIARIPEATAEKLTRHRMQLGDIVYGRRGDIGRRAFVMSHQAGWLCGTGCLRIRPNPRVVNGWFLFNYLGQDDVMGIIKGRAQGVTMPNLNTGVLSSVPVRLPPRTLQDDFARLMFPMAETHEALTAKIENLRRTRDLLLPRLLSGQIDVEAMEP